ncbi:iron-sulfur cluster assembly accessory protein [Proteobacteria bacterium 005FR1]|nr:iron-sulfur cluster assembly accessory protein [Proteobacteria bacterium 005FR1]
MTVATFDPSAPAVSVTDAALRHFEKKLAADNSYKLLRLSTAPSGCSGYQYVLDMVDEAKEGDELVQAGERVKLAIDPKAIDILRGTQIDLVREGVNQVVKFKNPNVVAECGCGESFSVTQ